MCTHPKSLTTVRQKSGLLERQSLGLVHYSENTKHDGHWGWSLRAGGLLEQVSLRARLTVFLETVKQWYEGRLGSCKADVLCRVRGVNLRYNQPSILYRNTPSDL